MHGPINSWQTQIGPAWQGDGCLSVRKQCGHMCRHCVHRALLLYIYFVLLALNFNRLLTCGAFALLIDIRYLFQFKICRLQRINTL